MKTQMTKDDYEKLVRIKKRELFEVNYQITIAESNDKKNLLMQKFFKGGFLWIQKQKHIKLLVLQNNLEY